MAITLVKKISISYGLLLLIALVCAAVAIWTSIASNYHLKRADLAHSAYESHLKISVYTTKLFKELQKGLLFEGASQATDQEELKISINQEFATIQNIIKDQIALSGRQEIQELDQLAQLEAKINQAISQYDAVDSEEKRLALMGDAAALRSLVKDATKLEVYDAIQLALEEEIGEVTAASADAMAMASITMVFAFVFGLLASCTAAASLFMLTRDITQPLQRIIDGARQFASGNYDHRIDRTIPGSLGQVVKAFNDAAKIAGQRQETLQGDNQRLEKEVARQTAELRRTILSLEEQKKARQRFLADVSHELRTPLTVIQGEVDIALRGDDKDPETYKEALSRASEAAKHTAQLVNDVLFIGRQEADQARLDLKKEDLVTLIRSVLETTQALQRQYKVTVDFIPETHTAIAPIDAGRLRQVLMILLENACHYGGNQILVRLMPSPEGFALQFKDNGPGIDAEDLEQIFTRYFRGSNAAERYEGGAGLGLPVAKSIIDAHDGRIFVSSMPGDGVNFKIILPARTLKRAVS